MSSMIRNTLALALVSSTTIAAAQSLAPAQQAWYAGQLGVAAMQSAAVPRYDPIGEALLTWRRLQQSDNLPFNDYASFLVSHPDWPGETHLREVAEGQINPDSYSPPSLIAYFERQPPLTATGALRYAEALASAGRADEAAAQARIAWRRGSLSSENEGRLMGRFASALTADDHDARMEQLIWSGDYAGAARVRSLTSPGRGQTLATALALRQGSNASSDAGIRDAAYLGARAMYMRDNGNSAGARSLLASRQPLAAPPTDPEEWIEVLLLNARAAASDRQWQTAYDIASKVDDAFPQGTDVSVQPLATRDDYTSLVWLAGTTALWQQGRAADAIGMFDRYARAARTPQTRSKGFYWAGRAAEQAGQRDQASAFYEQAAAYYDYFYGMLATERLGRPLAVPPHPNGAVYQTAAQAFEQRELVRATRMLGQLGAWQDQSQFLRALAEHVETADEHRLAGQFALQIGRPDLGVMVHRSARANGFDASDYGYPVVPMPSSASRDFAIAHGIMRQESQFDRQAESHAGARGLMQLMPGTAQEVSRRVGRPYSASGLTSDPSYNITLGTTYFRSVYEQWGNYVLAAASYNAGPGRARQWVAANGDPRTPGVDIVRWIEEIPIYETKNYVQRVLENAVMYDLLYPDRSTMGGVQNRISRYLGKNTPG